MAVLMFLDKGGIRGQCFLKFKYLAADTQASLDQCTTNPSLLEYSRTKKMNPII